MHLKTDTLASKWKIKQNKNETNKINHLLAYTTEIFQSIFRHDWIQQLKWLYQELFVSLESFFYLVGFIFWFHAAALETLASSYHGIKIAIDLIKCHPQVPWKKERNLAQNSQATLHCSSFTMAASCTHHWTICVNRMCCSDSQMSASERPQKNMVKVKWVLFLQ